MSRASNPLAGPYRALGHYPGNADVGAKLRTIVRPTVSKQHGTGPVETRMLTRTVSRAHIPCRLPLPLFAPLWLQAIPMARDSSASSWSTKLGRR